MTDQLERRPRTQAPRWTPGERLCPQCDSRLVLTTQEPPLGEFGQWWECPVAHDREFRAL